MIAEWASNQHAGQKRRHFPRWRHPDLTGAGHLLPQMLKKTSGPLRAQDAGLCSGTDLVMIKGWPAKYLISGVFAVFGLLAGQMGEARAQGVVKGKYGDWEMRCEMPAGASREQCALIQSIAAEDKPNVSLVVIMLKTADGKSRLLRVIAPLGVLIPAGLGLKIDNIDVGRAGFVRCLPTGCVAEVVMEDKLIDQLKAGKNATFIVFNTPEEGVGLPLALAGFGQGFDALP
jgi:invasion protein IalB